MKEQIKLLARSAMKVKRRTLVTNVFVRNGFKIVRTDFDDVTFENNGTHVQVNFDAESNAESVSILDSFSPKLVPRKMAETVS